MFMEPSCLRGARMKKFILVAAMLIATACSPATLALPTATQSRPSNTSTPNFTTTPTVTFTAENTPTATATLTPTETETTTPSPTPTESIGQMLKTRIVFYLIVPEKGHTDACGDFTLEPIISKRYRTGDKLQDVQIALNMLFNVGTRYYGTYYNALWQTDMNIVSFEYNPKRDYAIIDFGGFLPVMEMTACDKHGLREQVWKTFFHYGFKEKSFTINGNFLIDQLGR